MNFKIHFKKLFTEFLEKLLQTRELSETELKIINVISTVSLIVGFIMFSFAFLCSFYSLFFEPLTSQIDNAVFLYLFLFLESIGLVVNILILKRAVNKKNGGMSTLRLKKHLCFLGMTSSGALLFLYKYMDILSVITIWLVLTFSVFALIVYTNRNDCDKN